MDGLKPDSPAGNPAWPETDWNAVRTAGSHEDPNAQAALARLCETYRSPVFQYVLKCGIKPQDADDFVQEFFLHVLQTNLLERADAGRGRLRSFLSASLHNKICERLARLNTKKRGGKEVHVTPGEGAPEIPVHDPAPGLEFDRLWAFSLMTRALDAVAAASSTAADRTMSDNVRRCLEAGEFNGFDSGSLAQALGVSNDTKLRTAAHRFRVHYTGKLRDIVRETLAIDSKHLIDEEMALLCRIVMGE